jgi:CPA1 family monovalent cation:H+ antiporter
MLVEGESLLNDGTAVVVATIVIGLATGQAVSLGSAARDFLLVVGMGALVGGAVGFAASLVIQRVDDAMIEMTLTTVAAYGSFLAAESLQFSGVIATVTAGLICGTYAVRTGMSPTTRVAVASFWEYLAFALNSIVFLLIGFAVRLGGLLEAWPLIVLAFVAMTLARGAVLALAGLLLRRTRHALPAGWAAVLTWGGLRGSLSMVLVLGLPPGLALRETLVSMTFGVVVLSILVQGLSMGPLLRRLGLGGAPESELAYERLQGARRATLAAQGELKRLAAGGTLPPEVQVELQAALDARMGELAEGLRVLRLSEDQLQTKELLAASRQLLTAEKDALLTALRVGQLGQASYEALVAEVDGRLLELERPAPERTGA